MKKLKKSILFYTKSLRFIPHILCVEFSRNRDLLIAERDVWIKVIKHEEVYNLKNFLWLLNELPEYRSVLYYRLGNKGSFFLKMLASERINLFINIPTNNIGKGLVIQHGHSTIIEAHKIGENCQIWHNVTIGTNISNSGNKCTIGDNVKICAGAIVLGNILIGNNVTVGAGAVVVKSIPDNCVAVGNPLRIILKQGNSF